MLEQTESKEVAADEANTPDCTNVKQPTHIIHHPESPPMIQIPEPTQSKKFTVAGEGSGAGDQQIGRAHV